MIVLNSHIEVEIAADIPDSAFANAGEAILLDHSDRWDELPNVVKIAAALSAYTKCLEWHLMRREKLLWCSPRMQEAVPLGPHLGLQAGSVANRLRGPEERGVGGEEPPKDTAWTVSVGTRQRTKDRRVALGVQGQVVTLLLHRCHCKQGCREPRKSFNAARWNGGSMTITPWRTT